MATGRNTQLTRQIGEHLVCAELGRRGLIATPFAGNVPHFDLLVANEQGVAIPVQVKAINGPSWQFNAETFLDIEHSASGQRVVGPKTVLHAGLICVFVYVRPAPARDDLYVFRWRDLQAHFLSAYKGGLRPKNPLSTHCAIWPKDLDGFRDNWQVMDDELAAEGALRIRYAASYDST